MDIYFFGNIDFHRPLWLLMMVDVPIGKVEFFFKHKKNGIFPLDLACLEHLNVIVIIQFATNEQLKDLNLFFFESQVTNYIKKAYFFMF